jgi:signal transduction histidine kinase
MNSKYIASTLPINVNLWESNNRYAENWEKSFDLNQALSQQKIVIQAGAEEIDLEFIQTDLPKMLTSMKMGTDRIRQIVLSLRNFSRMDEADCKGVNIHEGIDNTLLILHHRMKDTSKSPAIQIIRDYGNLPLIECYPSQLNQALMNILANAIDALEEANINRTYQEIKENPIVIEESLELYNQPK